MLGGDSFRKNTFQKSAFWNSQTTGEKQYGKYLMKIAQEKIKRGNYNPET